MTKVFVMVFGRTLNSHRTFLDHLMVSSSFCEVTSVDDSDVIIAFVSIASRAGTDIQAALHGIPETRPVVLVVLHHTCDPNVVTPDSRLSVKRGGVFTVDCVFNEDRGLLRCLRNDEALKAVKQHLHDPECKENIREIRERPSSAGQHLTTWVEAVLHHLETYLKQRPWQLLFWTLALLCIILISCLSTPEYIHAVWFIPWMLLLLVVFLERRGNGTWNSLIIVIVNMAVILFSLTVTKNQKSQGHPPLNQSSV
ncbi:hypothetical protein MHYP_G00294990 [Metynnis hypsauchen]